jgi:alkylation response protein AidB-like acyl-CoA dehydrogenase
MIASRQPPVFLTVRAAHCESWVRIALAALLFAPADLTDEELELQSEVRAFLATELPRGTFKPGLGMAAPRDRAFSEKLARRGWLGMALPVRYGGHDRGAVDRFVVSEELLRWGAPVGHHWVADRQTGPTINRFGTEEQKERFLPPICRGEASFAIGMSEPEAGSDLAAVRTHARPVDGGWVVNGTKVWTSGAHESDWFVVLCRTSDASEDRHQGLSQLIVDLRSDGLSISSIPFLSGDRDFNEVALADVFVPDELVLGEIGGGWAQNTSELAYERGGPERWLSTYLLLEELLRSRVELFGDERARAILGEAVARLWAMRRLSLSVARMIDSGEAPAVQSALVKEMGTRFEQDLLAGAQELVGEAPLRDGDSPLERVLFEAVLSAPSFTIRGGTNEILRSVAAKGLGAL